MKEECGRMTDPLPKAAVRLLRVLKKIAPELTVPNGLPADGISHDPAVVDRYLHDPLVHARISPGLVLDLMDEGKALAARTEPYPVPLLVVQGSEDRLVDPAAAEDFALRAKGDVTYKRFEGWYHELHNEPGREELFHVIGEWIQVAGCREVLDET